MEAPSSAPRPRQVSHMTCGFAGLTSGTVARAHSSPHSQRCDLADVCRLRNDVADVLRELLKIITGLHEHGRLGAAAFQIIFSCYWLVVRGADLSGDR